MKKEALFHHANSEWGYVADAMSLTIRFRAAKDDVLAVGLVEYNRFRDYRGRRVRPMERVGADALFAYYEATFVPENYGCIYYFRIAEGDDVWFFGEYGLVREEPLRMGAFEMPRIQECDRFVAPSWMRDAIFYQIFPDRFQRLGESDPTLAPWGRKPTWHDVFGGNLKGIETAVPHLAELGVNAVYLTPIVSSPTCHRYDASDYLTIDPRLGTETDFKRLVDKLHQAGIRIVLDAVFNHSGAGFFAFRDVLANQEKSRYRNWFLIDSFPVEMTRNKTYQTFASEPHMPKLNSADPEVQDFLIGVGRHYIERFGIDGWRLDVADEVDAVFWRRFRTELKKIKPDLAIIGEVWHNADYYLRGDLFDSVQNYQFYEVAGDFFLRGKTVLADFSDRLTRLRTMYPDNVAEALLNALDSHDVPRALTQAGGDVRRLRLALHFLFTYPGMPCLYYGTEMGMAGGADPDNRRCVDWNRQTWDAGLLAYCRRLAALRREDPRLRQGTFRIIPDDRLFIYERTLAGSTIRFVMNVAEKSAGYDFTADGRYPDARGTIGAFGVVACEAGR